MSKSQFRLLRTDRMTRLTILTPTSEVADEYLEKLKQFARDHGAVFPEDWKDHHPQQGQKNG